MINGNYWVCPKCHAKGAATCKLEEMADGNGCGWMRCPACQYPVRYRDGTYYRWNGLWWRSIYTYEEMNAEKKIRQTTLWEAVQ